MPSPAKRAGWSASGRKPDLAAVSLVLRGLSRQVDVLGLQPFQLYALHLETQLPLLPNRATDVGADRQRVPRLMRADDYASGDAARSTTGSPGFR